jgi:hypothetical protein
MSEQASFPRRYRANLVFPPWEGHLPRALSPIMAIAAPEGSSDDCHGR